MILLSLYLSYLTLVLQSGKHQTHLPLDKMVALSQTTHFRHIFLNEKVPILTKISLKFVPKGPIDDNPALV